MPHGEPGSQPGGHGGPVNTRGMPQSGSVRGAIGRTGIMNRAIAIGIGHGGPATDGGGGHGPTGRRSPNGPRGTPWHTRTGIGIGHGSDGIGNGRGRIGHVGTPLNRTHQNGHAHHAAHVEDSVKSRAVRPSQRNRVPENSGNRLRPPCSRSAPIGADDIGIATTSTAVGAGIRDPACSHVQAAATASGRQPRPSVPAALGLSGRIAAGRPAAFKIGRPSPRPFAPARRNRYRRVPLPPAR
jgi:hypothetical protein